MRITGLGRIIFALSFAAVGVLMIGFHDFALMWIPKIIPWRDVPATVVGVLLFAGGIALLVPRTAAPAALVLAGLSLLRLLFQIRFVVAEPLIEVHYEVIGETLVQIAGAWTIFSMLPRGAGFGHVRAGQIIYGLALLPIGLSHFFYLNLTAPLIPSWLPFHLPLAYFTGAAHFAAGLGILLGVLPRLAATLEAIMVSLFLLLVWVPQLIAAPVSRSNWVETFATAAIMGAAWAVAESFRHTPVRMQTAEN